MGNLTQKRFGSSLGKWLILHLRLNGIWDAVLECAFLPPNSLGGITLNGFLIFVTTGISLAPFYHTETLDTHLSVAVSSPGYPLQIWCAPFTIRGIYRALHPVVEHLAEREEA